MSNSFANQILEATDTIVTHAISQVKFDETIICTIKEVFEDDTTKYWVSNGSTSFYAYTTDDTTYSKDAQVYVTIPLGDYSEKKIITGKYSTTDQIVKKVSLIDGFLPAMAIEFDDDTKEKEIDQAKFNRSLFGTLTQIKVDFGIGGEWENDSRRTSKYSLEILLYTKDKNNALLSITIPKNQMFGNPDNFLEAPTPQTFVFSAKEGDSYNINELTKISYKWIDESGTEINDIPGTSPIITFGYTKEEDTSEQLVLDYVGYYDDVGDFIDNWENFRYNNYKQKISLQFFYNDIIYNELNPLSEDENWTFYLMTYSQGSDDWTLPEAAREKGWVVVEEINAFHKDNLSLNTSLTSNQFKVVGVLRQTEKGYEQDSSVAVGEMIRSISSNAIIFEPEKIKDVVLRNGDLDFTFLNGHDNYYNIYGLDNKASTYTTGFKISADYYDGNKGKKERLKVEWKIPATGSMLLPKKAGDTLSDGWSLEGDYYIYTIETEPDEDDLLSNLHFSYDISRTYWPSLSNNTITCVVHRKYENGQYNETVTGSVETYFGNVNNNGTEYSFNIYSEQVGHTNKTDKIKYWVTLENSQGIEIDSNNYTVQWYKQKTDGSKEAFSIESQIEISYDEDYPILIAEATLQDGTATLRDTMGLILRNAAATTLVGPTQVIFDSDRITSSTINISYALYGEGGEIEDVAFSLEKINSNNNEDSNIPYALKVTTNKDTNKKQYNLTVKSILPTNPTLCYIVAKKGDTEYWRQPILADINTYSVKILNDWDGALNVDQEGNAVLTAMLAAGKKDSNNKFTGLLLSEMKFDGSTKYGLYAFSEGIANVAIREDGTFRFGGNDQNFIEFKNGELSIAAEMVRISSNKFALTSSDDNLIINSNYDINGSYLKVNRGEMGGWLVDSSGIHSVPYNTTNSFETHLWAYNKNQNDNQWIFAFYNFDPNAENHYPFFVTREGKLTAVGANIIGNIEATSGYIGDGISLGTSKKVKIQTLKSQSGNESGVAIYIGENYSSSATCFRISDTDGDGVGSLYLQCGSHALQISGGGVTLMGNATGYNTPWGLEILRALFHLYQCMDQNNEITTSEKKDLKRIFED